MIAKYTPLVLIYALGLSACGGASEPVAEEQVITPEPTPTPVTTPVPAPTHTSFNAELPGPEETDPQALIDYWQMAVEANQREAARRAWRRDVRGGGTAPRWSNLSDITVTMGEGRMEGAAGTSYYEIPVRIAGRGVDSTDQLLTGTMTLRRVNDVPGAEPEQLSWRIASIRFDN